MKTMHIRGPKLAKIFAITGFNFGAKLTVDSEHSTITTVNRILGKKVIFEKIIIQFYFNIQFEIF